MISNAPIKWLRVCPLGGVIYIVEDAYPCALQVILAFGLIEQTEQAQAQSFSFRVANLRWKGANCTYPISETADSGLYRPRRHGLIICVEGQARVDSAACARGTRWTALERGCAASSVEASDSNVGNHRGGMNHEGRERYERPAARAGRRLARS